MMRRQACHCLIGVILALSAGSTHAQQAPVVVAFAWDLDATHEPSEYISWELEVDDVGGTPCEDAQIVDGRRQCSAEIAQGAHTFRLRGILHVDQWCADFPGDEDCPPSEPTLVGEWSAPLEATLADVPGPFTIRFHHEIAVEDAVIGDTFDATVDTGLEDHTATGPHGGFGWTVTAPGGAALNDELIVSASTDDVDRVSSGAQVARANRGLGSADMRVSVELAEFTASTTRLVLVFARVDAGATNFYEYAVRLSNTGDTHQLFKSADGVITELAEIGGHPPAIGDTITIEVQGSTIRGLVNQIERVSATDTDVPNGEHAGFGGAGSGMGQRVDNFAAEILQ